MLGGGVGESAREEQEFHRLLLSPIERGLDKGLQFITDHWMQFGGASAAALWIYSRSSQQYELATLSTDNQCGDLAKLAELSNVSGAFGIGHYASTIRRPVKALDLATWRMLHEGQEYQVVLAPTLNALGVQALMAIPLQPLRSPKPFADIMMLYYESSHCLDGMNEDAIQRLSLHCGRYVSQELSLRIASLDDRMTDAAVNALTDAERPPTECRSGYLNELFEILRMELGVSAASVFAIESDPDRIACLGSTGLLDSAGVPVPEADLLSISYDRSEGQTGECFRTSEMIMGVEGRHRARYTEIHAAQDRPGRYLLCPILRARNTRSTVGVLRCADHRPTRQFNRLPAFNDLAIELIQHLAQLASPTLQALTLRKIREDALAVTAHEIEVPLGFVRDTVLELQSGAPTAQERTTALLDLSVSINTAINQLTRVGSSSAALAPQSTTVKLLEDVIAPAVQMMDRYARATRSIALQIDRVALAALPPIRCDVALVHNVVLNVIINAIKYGRSRSAIAITAERNAVGALVHVKNDGFGIAPGEEEKIFRAYYRSVKAPIKAFRGSGLGLFWSRKAMRAHGGDLRLTSRINPTIFTLCFSAHMYAPEDEMESQLW